MADVTPILIKDLAAQTTLQDTDYFIVGGADAKKITVAQMKEALGINELNTNMGAVQVLDIRTVSVQTGTVNPGESTTVHATLTNIQGAGAYFVLPISPGWLSISGISRDGLDIAVSFINTGPNPHSSFCVLEVFACKWV